ncbi:DNA polymerase III subunit chi [Candidatus Pantoea edessiphila]|uniref:DNA polymerase III subunit chi n=1 Tax=Candidatus Pantoea edessiphila TaxID=2044610 RepID=A0A2P5SY90_9GAMM|nr:DNA polymerase III subunit chi [Candidatus Pantoea edessiphila]MBK4775625.1 DNA polymerase III subunit chi [Pantoea sp. Edef]PPI87272.1 DNA polymerase III subunit chi [Candidatus Pantoea edessiphila]
MKQVTFYVMKSYYLSNSNLNTNTLLSHLSRKYWYQRKKVLVYCENKIQAIYIDDILWEQPLDAFIPHNIIGEGPNSGAPIEIAWSQNEINLTSYDILINLFFKFSNIFLNFKEIIDFAPYEEDYLKELARVRYKEYRKFGFKLNIILL